MKKITLISAFASVMLVGTVQAGDLYVEGSLGNATVEGSGFDESDNGFGLLVGYDVFEKEQFNVAVELGYNQYADFELDSGSLDVSSVALGTKLSFSPVDKLDLFTRLAYEQVTLSAESDTSFGRISISDTDTEFSYALGGSYSVVNNVSLGAQYKVAEIGNDADFSLVSLFANVSF